MAKAPGNGTAKITTDEIFDAYVVSSDENGNFYKTISIQDKASNPTVGLQIEVDKASNYATFPVGSHVRINANGLVIGTDHGAIKLGTPDPVFPVGRIPQSLIGRYISGVCNGSGLEIAQITPLPLKTLNEAKQAKYINMLVTVPLVQFEGKEVSPVVKAFTDVDASGANIDTDRSLEDASGNTVALRTSGFSTFAKTPLPAKAGSATFVVSRYNSSWQMIIRSVADLKFDQERIPKPVNAFFDDFSSNSLDTNWITENITGPQAWAIATFGNPKPSAIMNGFGGANEDWLISKPISLAGANKATLSFESDGRYTGPAMKLYIVESKDFKTAATTQWVELNATWDPDLNAFAGFVNSGPIDLSAYKGKDVRIAFKYTSTASQASSWEIDNVKVEVLK